MPLHYKKDGSLDMRYSSSKAAAASSSGGFSGSYGGYSGGPSSSDLHYKKDGSLDMRYASSKVAAASSSTSSSSNLHYKKDGSLDMRFNSSKFASELGHLQLSTCGRRQIPTDIPRTKSGLPDMRTNAGKEWVRQQAAGSFGGGIPGWLPTKKDGSLDMNKAVVQEYLRCNSGTNLNAGGGGGVAHRFRDDYYQRKLGTGCAFKELVGRCRSQAVGVPPPEPLLPTTQKLRDQFKSNSTTFTSPDLGSQLQHEIPSTMRELSYEELERTFADEKGVTRTLGSGSFGVVLKGTWIGRSVAVKRLHLPQLTRREKKSFVTEVKIMALIGAHTNIVTLYGYCASPPALVMEYVQLGSLTYLLHYCEDDQIEAKITDGRVKKRLATGIVGGMTQIHAVGVVHGDLKPANVLVTEDYIAKVTDFGLACLRGKTSSSVASKSAGAADEDNLVAGTGAYMAPELLSSSQPPASSCDVYSFGVLLNELVQEMEPFSGEEVNFHGRGVFGAANYAKLGHRPHIKEKTSYGLRGLIQDCWRPEASLRPSFEVISQRLTKLDIPHSF